MIEISNIRNFYQNNPLNLDKENFDLFKVFSNNSIKEIESIVLDTINSGEIIKKSSVKYNYDDLHKTNYLLIENRNSEIHIKIVLQEIDDNKYKIITVFPSVNFLEAIQEEGCYYPDEIEVFSKNKSAVGLSSTDIYDCSLLLERDYFEDENHDDVKWNIYGFAYPDNINKKLYNTCDCIGDEIIPFRKVKIFSTNYEIIKFNNVSFCKCYSDAALFTEFDGIKKTDINIKVPIYISENIIKNFTELYNGMELSVLFFGNIITV